MPIFLVIPFHLEQQAWFLVCVIPVVPISFRFIIPLTWCHADRLHLHEISRQMCHDHHQHYELFQYINWINDGKYHPFPRWFMLSSTTLFPSLQHKLVLVLCYTLSSLLSSICSSLPWNITTLFVKNVVGILPPLENSYTSDTYHHHHSFLGPHVVSNRDTNKWTMMFGFCTSSNPITLDVNGR